MKQEELKGKKITVMGLGLHGGGVGSVVFLSKWAAKIIVSDLKSKEDLKESLEKLKDLKNVEYSLGQHRPEDFTNTDLVVKSPSVPWSNKYIQMALTKKIPVETDSSLFFKFCPNPIIGITGTKGKTTTSTLIYEILKSSQMNPVKVGIGQVSVLDKIYQLKKDSWVVFELSSWRLSALSRTKMSPKIAVMTNIYPDHLNYYKSLNEYIADKEQIFLHQKADDFFIANWDSEEIRAMELKIKAQLISFSRQRNFSGAGAFMENDIIYFDDGKTIQPIINSQKIKLKGEHNQENLMAAIATAWAAGASLKSIRETVENFSGIFHRLEFVRERNGVIFYNDTAATTPESAISGIRSFCENMIWIGGGSDKNLNMETLADFLKKNESIRKIILIEGEGTNKLLKVLDPEWLKEKIITTVNSMDQAVLLAEQEAKSGEIVLLSPGAASFGVFKNEFDRGDQFKQAVMNLSE